jgi:beta-lactamase superfamily II metal-dependent hydrolase
MNGNSLWVKVTKGAHSVLITGDQRDCDEMLGAMIRHYGEATFKCDVLKITHHGEGNYSPHLIGAASPRFTIFTTSPQKAMAATVKLCEEMGCANYYTADGNLFFYIDEKGIHAYGIDPWHTPE